MTPYRTYTILHPTHNKNPSCFEKTKLIPSIERTFGYHQMYVFAISGENNLISVEL